MMGGEVVNGSGTPVHLIVIIFVGFGVADMSHDLMLLPSRSLLNDLLPESQLRMGNRMFATFTSLGTILGMLLVLMPFKSLPGLSVLDSNLSACFVVSAALIFIGNALSCAYPEAAAKSDLAAEAEASIVQLLKSIRLLPRQMSSIYFLQLLWWYVLLNQTFWWTTWMSTELFAV